MNMKHLEVAFEDASIAGMNEVSQGLQTKVRKILDTTSPGYPILMLVALINEYLVARLLCSPEYEVSLSKKKFFRLKYRLL